MTGALLKGSTADFPLPVLCDRLTLTAISRPYVSDSYALPVQVSRNTIKDVPYAFLFFPSASIWKPWGAQVLIHESTTSDLASSRKLLETQLAIFATGTREYEKEGIHSPGKYLSSSIHLLLYLHTPSTAVVVRFFYPRPRTAAIPATVIFLPKISHLAARSF